MMDSEDIAIGFVSIFLAFVGGFWGFVIGQDTPNQGAKTSVICEYLHAERHGNVCIKNNKVVFRQK
jgi:hypothetical protein